MMNVVVKPDAKYPCLLDDFVINGYFDDINYEWFGKFRMGLVEVGKGEFVCMGRFFPYPLAAARKIITDRDAELSDNLLDEEILMIQTMLMENYRMTGCDKCNKKPENEEVSFVVLETGEVTDYASAFPTFADSPNSKAKTGGQGSGCGSIPQPTGEQKS